MSLFRQGDQTTELYSVIQSSQLTSFIWMWSESESLQINSSFIVTVDATWLAVVSLPLYHTFTMPQNKNMQEETKTNKRQWRWPLRPVTVHDQWSNAVQCPNGTKCFRGRLVVSTVLHLAERPVTLAFVIQSSQLTSFIHSLKNSTQATQPGHNIAGQYCYTSYMSHRGDWKRGSGKRGTR